MERDFMDDNTRPGMVNALRSVPHRLTVLAPRQSELQHPLKHPRMDTLINPTSLW